jgi:hypothetical protein
MEDSERGFVFRIPPSDGHLISQNNVVPFIRAPDARRRADAGARGTTDPIPQLPLRHALLGICLGPPYVEHDGTAARAPSRLWCLSVDAALVDEAFADASVGGRRPKPPLRLAASRNAAAAADTRTEVPVPNGHALNSG